MREFFDVYKERDGICVSFYPLPKEQPKQEEIDECFGLDTPQKNNRKNGLYIHVPFCDKICSFCPFNKFVKKEETVERYLKGLKSEMLHYSKSEFAKSAQFDSVYLGGGTPTSLTSEQLVDILETVKKNFKMTDDAVYFVEGNPINYTRDKMEKLVKEGVNRISMGVQTFSNKIADYIGLPQTPAQSCEAIINAHEVGINNVGIDLMYPLPGMNYADWVDSINKAIELKVDHVCIIPFCLLPHTAISAKVNQGIVPSVPGKDDEVVMYRIARDMLLNAGYEQYSVLDFGIPDKIDKAALNYFRDQANLLAFGPAAYGYINGYTYFNVGNIEEYFEMTEAGKYPVTVGAKADKTEEMNGMMAKCLRMLRVNRNQFKEMFGVDPAEHYKEKLDELEEKGLLKVTEDNIELTEKGVVWGNDVSKEFFSKEALKDQISRVDLAKGRKAK